MLAPVKSNLSAAPASLEFYFSEDGVFAWAGEVAVDAQTLLAGPDSSSETGALAEAEEFLYVVLADGPRKTDQVKTEANQAGISERALRRAGETLGLKMNRVSEGNKGGGYLTWALPHDSQDGQGAGVEEFGQVAKITAVEPELQASAQDDQGGQIADGAGQVAGRASPRGGEASEDTNIRLVTTRCHFTSTDSVMYHSVGGYLFVMFLGEVELVGWFRSWPGLLECGC